jgi:hypothetical protein
VAVEDRLMDGIIEAAQVDVHASEARHRRLVWRDRYCLGAEDRDEPACRPLSRRQSGRSARASATLTDLYQYGTLERSSRVKEGSRLFDNW